MKLFGQLIRTAVNAVAVPVELAKDIVTLGGVATEQREPYTVQRIKKLVEDAQE